MTVAIVILNYKTADLVCNCLDSLAEERASGVDFEAFVGDAASGDGSVETISAHVAARGYGDWANCHDNGANQGFAEGNNVILRRSVLDEPRFEFVYFLNPDAYIRPGAVRALVEAFGNYPAAGAIGSKLENPDGSPRAYGFRFPAPWREFFRGARLPGLDRLLPAAGVKIENLTERREVDWVSGAAFMVRRSVIDEVGLMDGRYFLYFEEVDFLYRIRKAGYQVWHEPDSRVVHLAGQATGVRAEAAAKAPVRDYWLHSRWKFFSDAYGRSSAFVATLLFLLGDVVYRLHRMARLKPVADPPGLWRSYLRDGFSMPPPRPDRASRSLHSQ